MSIGEHERFVKKFYRKGGIFNDLGLNNDLKQAMSFKL